MVKKYRLIIVIIIFIIISTTALIITSNNSKGESTTKYTMVISKDRNENKQWIVIKGNKRIYVEDISLWALIEPNENYTIEYYLNNKEKNEYNLTTIVPPDFEGSF